VEQKADGDVMALRKGKWQSLLLPLWQVSQARPEKPFSTQHEAGMATGSEKSNSPLRRWSVGSLPLKQAQPIMYPIIRMHFYCYVLRSFWFK